MDKKTIVAIVFSALFILAWNEFVVKKQTKNIKKKEYNNVKVEKNNVKNDEINKIKNVFNDPVSENLTNNNVIKNGKSIKSEYESLTESNFNLENSVIKLTFSNRGGVLKSAILKNYKDKNGNNIELSNVEMSRRGFYPFQINSEERLSFLNSKIFKANVFNDEVVFRIETEQGFFEKHFKLGENYFVDFSILTNLNDKNEITLGPGIMNSEKVEGRYSGIQDQVDIYTDEVEKYEKKKIKKNIEKVFKGSWGAIENRYFTKIVDDTENGINFKFDIKNYKENDKTFEVSNLIFTVKTDNKYKIYMGPKQWEILKNANNHYEELVDFGFFGLFGKWLFFLLRWINGFVGNYGWAIVLMTLLIRVFLFPLNQMSIKSMKRMGEIQPKIKEIQAKYKKYGSDNTMKMKMNQEVAALYKKEGVNPAGGCLPMLIQMPVFFAIWGVLLSLIDLRNAEFIFWITDLSSRDPYYILPVLMGLTQFISQLITPSTGDKNQKMMMYAMPVVITAMLATAPSGLMVYWTTNNLFQMIQQIIINQQTKKES